MHYADFLLLEPLLARVCVDWNVSAGGYRQELVAEQRAAL